MATLVSKATGNFTAAGTWGVGEAGASAIQTTRSANTNTTTSYVYSSAFTVTNLDVIDGVVLYGRRLNTTGTVTIAISEDNGVTATREITVNASDLDDDDSTHFFLFPSTLTGDGGTDYKIGIKASDAANATFYRDGTAGNWFRIPRITTTAAPGAADLLYINGELTGAGTGNSFTVTMDNTASTTFGTTTATSSVGVGVRGTLLWGTAASTAYLLKVAGLVNIFGGGTWQQGTAGTPMPSTSSATLSFDCTANVDSGLEVQNGGVFESRGATKTVVSTLLTADEAAAATVIDVASTSGWLVSDTLGFASTTRTFSQYESKVILTVDSGVQVTLTAGLTNAHSGTAPTQAEVINLTRNVVITGESATLQGYINIKATASFTSAYTETAFMGSSTAAKRGIDTATTSGTFSMSFNSIHDFRVGNAYFLNDTGAKTGTWTVDNCVFFKTNQLFMQLATSSTGWTFTNNTLMGADNGAGGSVFINNGAIGTFNNNKLSSCNDTAITYNNRSAFTSFSGNSAHSCASFGLILDPGGVLENLTITSFTAWRNNGGGISLDGSASLYVSLRATTITLFGNLTTNLSLRDSGIHVDEIWDTLVSSGDSTFSTTNGIAWATAGGTFEGRFRNCTFGVVSGIKTAHTTDFGVPTDTPMQIVFENCNLASGNPIGSQTNLKTGSYLAHQKWQQTANSHRTYFRTGTITIDTAIFNSATPSERLTPNNASVKMQSGVYRRTVNSGSSVTFSAPIRKSSAGDGAEYNGAQPRLMLRANPALGVMSDTVLATYTAGFGSWNTISGATASATDHGVFEVYVDCDGTAGWINIDDISGV